MPNVTTHFFSCNGKEALIEPHGTQKTLHSVIYGWCLLAIPQWHHAQSDRCQGSGRCWSVKINKIRETVLHKR